MTSRVERPRALPRIRVSPGTLVTIAMLAVIVYPAFVAHEVAGPVGTVALAVMVGLALIVSVALHELAHAVLARAFGAQVEQIALTLWGGHTQYHGGSRSALAGVVISLAGPATNALIALAAGLAQGSVAEHPAAAAVLFYVSSLNWALAVFNLLPGLPMDGGRALEQLLGGVLRRPALGTVATAWIGRGIAVAVVALALWRVSTSGGSVDLLVMLWAVVISGTLWQGAGAALQDARTDSRVAALDLSALVRPVVRLDARASAADVPLDVDPRQVLVIDADGSAGRVDPAALASVPMRSRAATPIGAVTVPVPPLGTIELGEDPRQAVAQMVSGGRHEYLVRDSQGRERGTLTLEDVARRLRP